ncbi:unnamed protein product [Effrenium voratum]|nr:unnamed protein product [Effrenium voratum]
MKARQRSPKRGLVAPKPARDESVWMAPNRCYDGVQEMIPDEEVMSIEVSSSKDILLDGSRALLVSSGLREGHLHALQLSTLGVFRDEEGSPLLPHAGWEFWVQPDDSRTPEIFMQAPEHGGEAATNSNITLFFSEALQADMAGVINISDGLQDEIIMISTPSSSKGEGYVLVHGAVVIINPSLDFGYGRMVTVNFEPGVFRDLAGNLFPGLSGEYYFYTAPSQFALAAPYVRYPSFRSPRFTPREGAMLHFVNDTLILYGGISNGVCLADTWVSRTGAEWTQVTGVISDHNRLVPLVSHSPTSVDGNGCIWLLGGRCNSDAGTLWKTCDIGRSWSHVPRPTPIPFGQEVPPKFPDAFRDHAMTVLGGWQLIVVDASPGTSEAVWRFNSPAADHVQRVSGGSADAVSRKGPLPFGLRRGPKLMATSQGGLFLVGGNLCPANGGNCSFNDVWYSPDVGVTWHCKTKNYGAKTLPATWQGIGEGFAAALTQDDTIFLMAGEVPGDQESALAETLESFTGLEDIYLSQPYMVLPGSVSLGASPARPDANFTILFSERS